MATPTTHTLEYHLTEKSPFLVLTFVGEITRAAASVLEQCEKELTGRERLYCVLNFRDVSGVDFHCVRALVHLQKVLRDKGALRLCALNPDVKQFLTDKIAVRVDEIAEDLKTALESLHRAL